MTRSVVVASIVVLVALSGSASASTSPAEATGLLDAGSSSAGLPASTTLPRGPTCPAGFTAPTLPPACLEGSLGNGTPDVTEAGAPEANADADSDEFAPQGDWSIFESANGPATQPTSAFNGLACASPSDCWAVGYGFTGSAFQSLIEHWDGSSWRIVPSPNTSDMQLNVLYDVTCVSPSDCWAVGYSSTGTAYRTLVVHWNGSSWSMVGSPNASATDVLSDVTCVSAANCWATGYTYSSPTGVSQTLIERWDGTSWSIVASPNTSMTEGNFLTAAHCQSASSCWAVGSGAGRTLIVRWDGTGWTIVTSPNKSGYGNGLSGVTCVGPTDCWAVGASSNGNDWRTLIVRWDGTSWTIVSSPNGSALYMNSLTDVTCASESNCWAVGGYFPGTTWQTLAQRWDGSSWSIVSSRSIDGYQNILSSVMCLSGSDCRAVGSVWGTGTTQTLMERWEGASWDLVASPNTVSYNTNVLSDVACISASDCWAVGHYYPVSYGAARTLIEHWDGTSWSVVTASNVGSNDNFLVDVTCATASDCLAVGYRYGESGAQSLVQRWDGESWQVVPSANTGIGDVFLSGVACVSASDCWAVGKYKEGSPSKTLIAHWDGTSWTQVPSPNPGSSDQLARRRNELSDVTCVSASSCWAVGSYDVDSPAPTVPSRPKTSRTLIMRWNGTEWNVVPSPDTLAVEQHFLSDVTCVSASACWAVGYSRNAAIAQTFVGEFEAAGTAPQTLVKRWDGTSWTTVASPNSSAMDQNVLSSVTCASTSECWAVGSQYIDGIPRMLIERWDGTSWTTVPSPNAARADVVSGVSCAAASDCWAVGNSHNGINSRTLTVRYAAAS